MLMWIYQQHPRHSRLHHVFPSACAKPLKATLLSPINLITEIGSVVSSYFQFILQLLGCKCHEQMLAFNNKSEHFLCSWIFLDIYPFEGTIVRNALNTLLQQLSKRKRGTQKASKNFFFFKLLPEPAINNFLAPNVGGFFV